MIKKLVLKVGFDVFVINNVECSVPHAPCNEYLRELLLLYANYRNDGKSKKESLDLTNSFHLDSTDSSKMTKAESVMFADRFLSLVNEIEKNFS